MPELSLAVMDKWLHINPHPSVRQVYYILLALGATDPQILTTLRLLRQDDALTPDSNEDLPKISQICQLRRPYSYLLSNLDPPHLPAAFEN